MTWLLSVHYGCTASKLTQGHKYGTPSESKLTTKNGYIKYFAYHYTSYAWVPVPSKVCLQQNFIFTRDGCFKGDNCKRFINE